MKRFFLRDNEIVREMGDDVKYAIAVSKISTRHTRWSGNWSMNTDWNWDSSCPAFIQVVMAVCGTAHMYTAFY